MTPDIQSFLFSLLLRCAFFPFRNFVVRFKVEKIYFFKNKNLSFCFSTEKW